MGVIIVISKDLVSFDTGMLLGALCCALGAVSYGLFTALIRKSGYDKSLSLMFSYFVTFFITGSVLLVSGGMPQPSWGQLWGLAWNGAATMGLANTMWMLALSCKDTAKISNLAYVTPALSLVWLAIFVEKDGISPLCIVGLGVILVGIFVPILYEMWRKKKSASVK